MKALNITIIFAALIGACFTLGCSRRAEDNSEKNKQQRQLEQIPILIAEKDGVRLYKVRDITEGGSAYVYFTVPSGDTQWKEGKNQHRTSGRP